ncbi:ABC transporter ATP-binding protein [Planctomycetota bacterium]
MNNTAYAIEIRNLTVEYPTGLLRKPGRGVKDLTFSVEKGELFGFLGPNGAGKTTTIKVLTGLLPPNAGEVKLLGEDIADKKTRFKIGYMPENPYFYEYLTAKEALIFYGGLFNIPKEASIEKGKELLKTVGLKNVDRVKIGEYSKGMRQRLGFAQAIINDPEVLILDEPLSGLDPIGRSDLMSCMRNLHQQGKTVFFSSHILPDVEHTCTKVGLIHEGKLLQMGPMEEILRTETQSVSLVVRADEKTIKECAFENLSVSKQTSELLCLTVTDHHQASALIRKLTENNIDIVSLSPERRDLETFFVEKIKQKE